MIVERAPDRVVVVDGDRIGQTMIADPTFDVLGAFAEFEFRRVDADHDQAERRVLPIPRLDVRRSPNPVDAGVFPEVDQHDFSTQCLRCERRRF